MSNVAYAIVPSTEITQEMIDVSTSLSLGTMLKSIDGTRVVVEFLPPQELFDSYDVYDNAAIKEILMNEDWMAAFPGNIPSRLLIKDKTTGALFRIVCDNGVLDVESV